LRQVDKNRLHIRDANSLELIASFTCLDTIDSARWSPDSTYILCSQYKRNIVQVRDDQNLDFFAFNLKRKLSTAGVVAG